MNGDKHSKAGGGARLSFWLLTSLLIVLWLAGGASRAEVLGQTVARFFAWSFLVVLVLVGFRVEFRRVRTVAILLGLAVLMPALQLIPLPPGMWTALPGRDLFVLAAEVSGQDQPWRPISVSPAGTVNALGALIIPVTVLFLAANLDSEQHWKVLLTLLCLVFAGSFLALLQFSGANYDNPLINYRTGVVAGNFSNRNHFALFAAIGCLLAPIWGYRSNHVGRIRSLLPIAVVPFLVMVILATGSRAGIVLGLIGTAGGFFIVRRNVVEKLRAMPRWLSIGMVAGTLFALALAVFLSVIYGRAYSVDRILGVQEIADLRTRALPYVMEAVRTYFPVGAGFGTFDPVYRIVEPDELLQVAYFNHAHNDFLEILLDGGLFAAIVLALALAWWLRASIAAWRRGEGDGSLPQAASIIILMVLLASVIDYPARTPMIMAVLTLAAVWLARGRTSVHRKRGDR